MISHALYGTQASATLLDFHTGKVLVSTGKTPQATPGSTIKPLLLEYALSHRIVQSETKVYCRRNLQVGDHFIPCTHPTDHPVFTAESALAESCNTWFAEMARRFTGPELEAAIQTTHLAHASMNNANIEQRQLATLGLQSVYASPLQLAQAYRQLLQRISPDSPVAHGLRDSVLYGMANSAAIPGIVLLGKTGTASNPGEAWTHGWFVGAVPNHFVLVLYVPHGDGGTAAYLAHDILQNISGEGYLR